MAGAMLMGAFSRMESGTVLLINSSMDAVPIVASIGSSEPIVPICRDRNSFDF